MREYKTPAEQRARMTAYYYKNKERILEYKRQQREKELQHKSKHYPNLIEMYQDWSLSLIEKLQTKKHPKWIQRGILHMIMQLDDRINEMETNKSIKINMDK